MITNFQDLNEHGDKVKKNKIGVVEEKIYGANWKFNGKKYTVTFNYPVFPYSVEKDSIILIYCPGIHNGVIIYNAMGEKIKEFTTIPGFEDSKNEVLIHFGNFGKDGHLHSFNYSVGELDYTIDFDVNKLEFGSDIRKIRL